MELSTKGKRLYPSVPASIQLRTDGRTYLSTSDQKDLLAWIANLISANSSPQLKCSEKHLPREYIYRRWKIFADDLILIKLTPRQLL
ncbi:hypothetical protein NPIL_578491 [Nephila pilipes]|uniref:Uncharacterized protein n=1 Tax=Nephila pilipes TaxID=299642 RepID=A0A8X6PNW0_NEPPI|nr:hypothetical protein NPIL_578491 [Nephila pilipes]